jgi:uncharacterized lipoprotein YddW (UPF0748 family)
MNKIKYGVLSILIMFMLFLSVSFFSEAASLIVLTRSGITVTHYNTTDPVMIPDSYSESQTEFRGVWVATVYNLNMPLHTSETQYKTAYQALIAKVKAKNMNAILFQVRPNNDAFYQSSYAPWSRWLTGTEGTSPGWDVMQYMIDYAHSQGIEFHAWMNPYRVQNSSASKTSMLSALHSTNFARINPNLVIAGNPNSEGVYPYILNPGEPAVKTYIRNVVTELITLYNVDGVHFDDYFYPYSGLSSDSATYDTYKLAGQTLGDWRRENVNDVVRGVMEDVVGYNTTNDTDIRFGISPFGIWQSQGEGSNTSTGTSESYYDQYADSKRWVEEGWLHYIMPQVYWSFEHATAPYADVVDWWASVVRGTDVDLIIGHGAHNTSWATDELQVQLRYNQKHPEIKGSSMYSAAYLESSQMTLVGNTYWTETPLNMWAESNIPNPEVTLNGTMLGNLYTSNVTATMTSPHDIFISIDGGAWTLYTEPLIFDQEKTYSLHVKAISDTLEESLISGYTITIDKQNNDIPVISITGDMISTSYVLGSMVSITSTSETIWVAINHGSVGEWNLYTGPITLDDTGNYYIRTKTINGEGVESIEVNRLITVVQACYPEPEIELLGTGTDPYYREATLSINGQTSLLYRINGGEWTTYTDDLYFGTEGEYTVEYKNDDACGTIQSITFTIDLTAPLDPTITIDGPYDGRYYTGETTVTLAPSALGDIVYFRLHNGSLWTPWALFSEALILNLNVTYTLEYYAEDLAGNTSDVLEERLRMDIPPDENNEYVIRDGTVVTYYNSTIPIQLPIEYIENEAEVRAVWVATVNNIDIPLHTSEAQYKAEITEILDTLVTYHFNTVFLQVRPMNDAFYPSEYAPFSRYLTGIEGQDPGWDVLEFWIEEGHKRGIEIHAWLNPYRVSTGTGSKESQLALLHDDNFAKLHPDLVLQDLSGRLILNPGENQVRAYIKNIVQELMSEYNIDGIHFDDYFYSYNGMDNAEDAATYERTKEIDQSLADWRRENVNILVSDLFSIVESYNVSESETVKFGISPFGIWQSQGLEGSNTSPYTLESYHDQYADTKKWVEEGWLHYIMPQFYWEFDHSSAPYADLVDWWAELCSENEVDLIIGHGFYRFADGSWEAENELMEQLRYNQKYDIIKGSSFFSYKTLNSTNTLVVQSLERLMESYWTEYVTFPWPSDVEPEIPVICEPDETLVDGICVPNPPVCEPDETLIDGICVPNPPICEPDEELIDGVCVPITDPEEPNVNQTVVTIAIVGGSVSGLAVAIYLVRKFVLKL